MRREEVCKQVGCERERMTLYIINTNFPLINMQQLKHIIFQDLLNEPRSIKQGQNLSQIVHDGLGWPLAHIPQPQNLWKNKLVMLICLDCLL